MSSSHMLTSAAIRELQADPLGAFLVRQLERAFEEGGNTAVVEKLDMWGLSSANASDRETAQTLARMWVEKE
jgi:hypothetical protein